MLHCPLDPNSNLCKDSFFPFVSSSLLLLSLFFLQWIPLIRARAPVLYCQTVSIFYSFSPSVTPPRSSSSVCFPACLSSPPSLSSRIDLHFFLLHFAVPLSLCCHPSIPCIHLTLSFSTLFYVLPLLVQLTPQVVKSEKKKVNCCNSHSAFSHLSPSLFSLHWFEINEGGEKSMKECNGERRQHH